MRRNRWWLLGLLAIIVQLVAIYRPSPPPLPSSIPDLDKVGHLAMFAAPVLCLLLATRTASGRLSRPWLWVVPVVFLAHAVTSEMIQYAFYSRRSGDPFDALADSVGVALGLLVAWFVSRRLAPGTAAV